MILSQFNILTFFLVLCKTIPGEIVNNLRFTCNFYMGMVDFTHHNPNRGGRGNYAL